MRRITPENVGADTSLLPDNPKVGDVILDRYFRPGGEIKLLKVEFLLENRPLLSLVRYATRDGNQWVQPPNGLRIDRDKGFIDAIEQVRGSRRYLRRVGGRVNRIVYLATRELQPLVQPNREIAFW